MIQVKMVGSEYLVEIGVTKITSNSERETITIHTNREIYTFEENLMIEVRYFCVICMSI